MTTTVFVTGATGFIAQHVVKQLVQKGYRVIGTVRSTEKGDRLAKNLNTDLFSYEIVKELADESAFDAALKKHPEVSIFLHTASPFAYSFDDVEKGLLLPAIRGTESALNAVKKFGKNVTKVVITSSMAAVNSNFSSKFVSNGTVNESNWTEITWEDGKKDPVIGYPASKAFAERASWEFLEKEKPNFKLTTVNPTYVFGPQAFDSEAKGSLNTSSEVIASVLRLNANDPLPSWKGGYIDVRDVARAHLVAFENADTADQRLLVYDSFHTAQQIANIVREKFPSIRDKIPVGNPDESASTTALVDSTKSKKLLGFQFIDFETSVYDSVAQLLKVQQ